MLCSGASHLREIPQVNRHSCNHQTTAAWVSLRITTFDANLSTLSCAPDCTAHNLCTAPDLRRAVRAPVQPAGATARSTE
ncbi:uncharacterized protein PHACADRAFT_266529 [Phanerochaete carnosa HHB-10118-sp]|uniref:Uncharacterized protein n=1 Tax=Phanerochaete carnosa (strain HHB-10118-sp) TaxID=650164 RepID=K5VN85_PHACS|nr:uncharacterized protein PHACADRAFT_266529 [Phanerochaete carnosa HHB-10118-sp]EKM48155.1 hypothetical protein PHACADRAFT_266529 [Phanerochaete carnosa HHB-10118-sp]